MAPPEDNAGEAAAAAAAAAEEEGSSKPEVAPAPSPEKAAACGGDGCRISTVLIIIVLFCIHLPSCFDLILHLPHPSTQIQTLNHCKAQDFQFRYRRPFRSVGGTVRFPKGVPWVRYHGKYKELDINLVWPGKDSVLGVDSVGTVSTSIVTYASIQAVKPDLIINAGTAGGFKVFDMYGIGARRTFSTPNLLKELNLKVGKLSTGDSLDMSPQDEASILANDATIKDMEGAAVAYVAGLLSVPAIFVKAVTDIVDGEKPTSEEFLQNLIAVTAALDQAVSQVIDFLSGKCLSEL
ncbi:5'-methylthioadenosine/S-adenosylhomocysteine nucleosidase 2 [Cocos nucifera]|uniref:5'-methylthioadenosine/S-adenosylhomocysteine nucleosidase 2 n=1 Tax=Cocos nucifera TaxID=13894 RepID=A0A8K0N6A8_COCNU|nr:5'-methylthioadenosine/S-adenosylhomocysteine nucleosidase 2 [Cocos nucifera]